MAPPPSDSTPKSSSNLRRATIVIATCTILGAAIGYLTTKTRPQLYNSEALLLAQMGREVSAARSDLAATGNVRKVVSPGWREFINTEVALLKSVNLMANTKRLTQEQIEARRGQPPGPIDNEPVRQGLIAELRATLFKKLKLEFEGDPQALRVAGAKAMLAASLVPRSNVLRLSCVSEHPDVSALMIQNWIELYLNNHIITYTQADRLNVFEEQAAQSGREVAQAEAELAKFRTETGFFDIDIVKEQLLAQKSEAEAFIRANAAEIESERARVGEFQKLLAGVPEQALLSTSSTSNALLVESLQRLADEMERLAAAQTDDAALRGLSGSIRELIVQVGDESVATVNGRNPIHDLLVESKYLAEATLRGLEAQKGALAQGLAHVDGQLAKLEQARPQHTKLLEELASATFKNENMTEAVRIGRISLMLDEQRVTNVRVIAPPSVHPLSNLVMGMNPKTLKGLVGGVLGFLLSVLTFFAIRALREAGILRPT